MDDASPGGGMIIAIDGPAGTGKSSVARLLAQQLGFRHIDTGALYRAIATLTLAQGYLSLEKESRWAIQLARHCALEVRFFAEGSRIFADGADLTDHLRSAEVGVVASRIAALPAVREALLSLQRRLGDPSSGSSVTSNPVASSSSVVEGRDIGSVVFPQAAVKFFLTADPQERARRRLQELQAAGDDSFTLAELEDQLRLRDLGDSQRSVAPLIQLPDAVVIDTSCLTLEQVVEQMVAVVQQRMAR